MKLDTTFSLKDKRIDPMQRHMEVQDNGIRMKDELIEQVLSPSEKGVGYGIRNVDQRIKLQFGKAYGVSIISSIGEGTTIRIRFPKLTPKVTLLAENLL